MEMLKLRLATANLSELNIGAYLELARLHRCAKHCGQGAWDLELSAVIP
jgi:hypothetical protein